MNIMNKKKKIIIIACVVLLLAAIGAAAFFYFSNDKEKPPTLEETVESRIAAYETDLTDSMDAMTDQASVARYLVNWAENKGIDVKTDLSGNVIYSIEATKGFEKEPAAVILCGYDYTGMMSYKNSIVCALTAAKNDAPHGAYKVIFISEEAGSTKAAEALSDKYFTSDTAVFCLGDTDSSRIALSTGGFNRHVLSKKLNYVTTSYDVAYKVSISGLPSNSFKSMNSSEPNPIKMFGELLANFKSTSILFELASFTGGISPYTVPQEASITIVVNKDAAEKLESNLENAVEKFYDKYSDDYPDAQYTFEVVETPSNVISTEDTESIVSLLYTAINGVHYKDNDGEIASIANIGYISTENSSLKIEVGTSSYSEELTGEMLNAYQTISALTDVDYSCTETSAPFHANKKGENLAEEFTKSYNNYKSIGLDSINMAEWTPALAVSLKNKDMPVIVLGVTEKTKDNFAGGLITYFKIPADDED